MMRVLTLILGGGHSGTIERAIVSALGQHTRERHCVVVFAADTATLENARRFSAGGRLSVESRDADETPLAALRAAAHAFDVEYVALLDGDGWWTSLTKLQRQIEFLDQHTGSALVCHRAREVGGDPMVSDNVAGTQVSFGLGEVIPSNVVPPCSTLVRRSVLKALPAWSASAQVGLWPAWICAATHGRLACLDEELAAHEARKSPLASTEATDRDRIDPYLQMYGTLNQLLDFRYDDLFRAAAAQPRWRWAVRAHSLRRTATQLKSEVDLLTDERQQLYHRIGELEAEQGRLWEQIGELGRLAEERPLLYARIDELGRQLEATRREAAPLASA